ncbi:unnamed protein product, partial [Acanthoscelides obtectus]
RYEAYTKSTFNYLHPAPVLHQTQHHQPLLKRTEIHALTASLEFCHRWHIDGIGIAGHRSAVHGAHEQQEVLVIRSWINVEYTRLLLHANLIPAPAQQSTVVHLRDRFVVCVTPCLFRLNLALGDVVGFRGVIELPYELDVRWVGLQLARDADSFVASYSEDLRLTGSAGFHEFSTLVQNNNLEIVGISETWLSKDISNDHIRMNGYNCYRCDRDGRGGGVAIFVNSH